MSHTLAEISKRFNLDLDGDPSIKIENLCGLTDNLPGHLSFVSSAKHVKDAAQSNIPAFVTKKQFPIQGKANLYSENPEYTIAAIANLYVREPMSTEEAIHPSAYIGQNVKLSNGVHVGPRAVIGNDVCVGPGTKIYAGAVIMDRVSIGEDCIIYPNVTIREDCELKNRVILQPGAVIGGDGYGFVFNDGMHRKIPQVGNVILEDDVEIGSNTTVDRGRFTTTKIGKGTKLDNLIHIGHNVQIGENCLLVAQTGISGSTSLGNNVTMAGQTGVVGHIHIADGVTVLGQSMVSKSIKESGIWAGSPAKPANIWRKAIARFYKIDS
jgi:UDP-3-O-[3-hydroxymyristoyl] glucosamine N-acyltransferase